MDNKLKLLSLFSGIGAFEKSLENIGIDYEIVNYCEIDKYASRSYSAIHNVDENKNLFDVNKVDGTKINAELITYGFPCVDISNAGKQKGFKDENGNTTRSGLFFEALRIIKECQPRIAIAENVKALTGKKFEEEFETVLSSLNEVGYNNYWQVLNAKDFGIPQNRERVFIVSIRKDIDKGFEFPKGFPLDKSLIDFIEKEVDEKYYLEGKYEEIVKINENYSMLYGGTIGKMHDISRRVYELTSVSPTIHTSGGGYQEPKVMIPVCLNSKGGRKGIENLQPSLSDRVYDSNAISCAVTCSYNPSYTTKDCRVRKLTPKDMWLLMGFSEKDYKAAKDVVSETQLKKQAGNSIVVPVLENIFENMRCYIGQ